MSWLALFFPAFATGLVYALLGLGVVLTYRVSRVLPIHLGEVAMISAYIAATISSEGTGGPLSVTLGIAAGVLSAMVIGHLMYLIVERVGGRFGHFTGTMLTVAVATILLGAMSYFWGGEAYRLPLWPGTATLMGLQVPAATVASGAISAVLLPLTVVYVHSTRSGLDMQAVANNATLASLRGISINFTRWQAWMIGHVLSGIAGILIGAMSVVSTEGVVIGITAVVAAIMGGLTSLVFCIVGAIAIALGESVVTIFMQPRYAHAIPVIILLLLLVVRPSGLAGQTEQIERV